MKTLQNWLNHIESFHPSEIELGLERITELATRLGLIKLDAKIITVGGTNGKGSCVATLESLARESNLNVGCYTSPHLVKFNERIRVNCQNVSNEILISTFEKIDKARADLPITFFEFTTLVALSIFKNTKLDLIVLEVGLGGRLDAVNIIEPDITIITTIDKDHESWLGSELNDIAFEKSGICRKDSINYVGDIKSHQLIKNARSGITINLVDQEPISFSSKRNLKELINDCRVNPFHLLEQNVKLAVVAFDKLFKRSASNLDLTDVISNIEIRGRFQEVVDRPKTVVDVAHNVQAAANLSKQIGRSACGGTRYAICGLMADKSIKEFLKIMNNVIDRWVFVDLPIDRAAHASEILHTYNQIDPDKSQGIADSVIDAYQKIIYQAEENDQIYVFGSFITVAEMLHYLDKSC